MNSRFLNVVGSFVAISLFAAISFSQGRTTTAEKFIISAKAGGVNVVMGDVSVTRESGRTSRLFKGDELQVGEKVATGFDGKAEILMNPGSYIRLGANAEFAFDSTDLNDVRVNLGKGSAIFEVFGAEEYTVDVKAGSSRFALIETGIYRVDVDNKGEAVVSIHKGKVLPGLDIQKSVGSGKQIDYSGTAFVTAKFDKNSTDELGTWSKERAKQLSQVSASLRPDRLRDPLISSFNGNRWNLYSSMGLWIYDPFFSSYCFLPFGYGWSSPYGFGFGRPLWYYKLPVRIYNAPPPSVLSGNATTKGSRDRGFVDVIKRADNNRKVNSDGQITVRQPTRVRVEPPAVYDSSTKMPVIESVPVIVSPTKTSTRRP